MKLLIVSAILVSLYAGAGMAQQTQYPGTGMAQQTLSDPPPAAEPPVLILVTGNEARHARDADARHCLAMKDNLAVIRCAERYRYIRVARAGGN